MAFRTQETKKPQLLPHAKDGDRPTPPLASDTAEHQTVTAPCFEDLPIYPTTHTRSPAATRALGYCSIGAWFAMSMVLGAALGCFLMVLLFRSEISLGPQDPAAMALTAAQNNNIQHQRPQYSSLGPQDQAAWALTAAQNDNIQLALPPSFPALPPKSGSTVDGALGNGPQTAMLGTYAAAAHAQDLDGSNDTVHCSDGIWKDEGAPEPLVWVPQPNRFLLAACTFGRASNRLQCLKRTLIAGALLNRTVVIPEQDMCPAVGKRRRKQPPYRVQVQVSLPGLKSCLSGNRGAESAGALWHGAGAITLQDFLAKNQIMKVDKSVLEPFKAFRTKGCRFAPGIKLPRRHEIWRRRFVNLTLSDVAALRNATASARVLLLGDLFYFGVKGIPVDIKYLPRVLVQGTAEAPQPKGFDPGRPPESIAPTGSYGPSPSQPLLLQPQDFIDPQPKGFDDRSPESNFDPGRYGPSPCHPLLRPPQDLIDKANGFIALLSDSHFAALHLRRRDFKSYCMEPSCPSCPTPRCNYFSIDKIAACLSTKMKRLGLKSLFVATDAGQKEVESLKEHLSQLGISMFRLTGVPWKQDSEEYAMTEKIVASQASVFFHSDFSTFSGHISDLRFALGKRSCEDVPPCP